MKRAALLLLLAFAPGTANAQVRPQPGPGDPRIQTVDYAPDQVVRLEAAPGYQLMLELAPDEHIENIALGDSGAWQATANRRGDRLFIKAVQPGVSTNMTVVTDNRLYNFELNSLSAPAADTAWSVKFRYPAAAAQAGAQPPADKVVGRYKVRGDPALRPNGIHDDGIHTYVEWPEERALPAIYAINDQGKETLVNGMMRDGRMVIDSVQDRLVFRIDKHKAQAVRFLGER